MPRAFPLDAHVGWVLNAAPSPLVLTDAGGTIRFANAAAEELFGYRSGELAGQPVDRLVPTAVRAVHAAERSAFSRHPIARSMGGMRDVIGQKRDGTEFPAEVGLSPLETSDGTLVLASVVDLTERKRWEHQLTEKAELLRKSNLALRKLAATDALTQLWNRRALLDQVERQMEQAVRRRSALSLLMVDLDHFKDYNDAFGHPAGDEVLIQAAKLLTASARRADFTARLGGEEFAVLMADAKRHIAERVAERIRAAFEDTEFPRRGVNVSIGSATLDLADGRRPEGDWRAELLDRADRALYRAKQEGRNRCVHADAMR